MTRDSGCGMEDAMVWTWDSCDDAHGQGAGHLVASARQGSEPTCASDHRPNAVRCCADSEWVGIEKPPVEDQTVASVLAGTATAVVFFGLIGLYRCCGSCITRRRQKGPALMHATSAVPKSRALRGMIEIGTRSQTAPGGGHDLEEDSGYAAALTESARHADERDGDEDAPSSSSEPLGALEEPEPVVEPSVHANGSSKAKGKSKGYANLIDDLPEPEPRKPTWDWDDGEAAPRPPTKPLHGMDLDDDEFATMRL